MKSYIHPDYGNEKIAYFVLDAYRIENKPCLFGKELGAMNELLVYKFV